MRFDKLTSKFQLAFADAQSAALGKDQQFIEPEHVLLSMLLQEGGSIPGLLAKVGVPVAALREELQQLINSFAAVQSADAEVHVSQQLTRLLLSLIHI